MILLAIGGCQEKEFYPKPRGYFRIALPEKAYQPLDSNLAYRFDYPVYAKPESDPITKHNPNWINLSFPQFKGRIHLSYKKVDGNLGRLIDDSHEMVNKHIPKANSINSRVFANDSAQVYGLVYDIKGTGAATPVQFYLTDSIQHFVRGALYFETRPNNDSLAPVIDFIDKDITKMIETFQWNENDNHRK